MPKFQLKYRGKPKKGEIHEYNIVLTVFEFMNIDMDLIWYACDEQYVLQRWDRSWRFKNMPDSYILVHDQRIYVLPDGKAKPKEVTADDLIYIKLYTLEELQRIVLSARENLVRLELKLERLEYLWQRI